MTDGRRVELSASDILALNPPLPLVVDSRQVTSTSVLAFLICKMGSEFCQSHGGYWEDRKKEESEVAQSCPTLCDPVDYSPPGSFLHEILQARILEWVAISFCSGASQPRDRTRVSHIAGRFVTI